MLIKGAVKRGVVVVMDSDNYATAMSKMLSTSTSYAKASSNCDEKGLNKFKQLLDEYNLGTRNECNNLCNFNWKTSNFSTVYLQYPNSHQLKRQSVHKETHNVCIKHPDDLTFRPIVGDQWGTSVPH